MDTSTGFRAMPTSCLTCVFCPTLTLFPELQPRTGIDKAVADYVFQFEETGEFLADVGGLVERLLPKYEREGKAYLNHSYRMHRRASPAPWPLRNGLQLA